MSIISNALLSEQEIIIRESARRAATDVVGSTAAERDRTGAWPHAEIEAIAKLGFMGMLAPASHGGSELSFTEYCLTIEEFAAADGGFATMMHVHNSAAYVLRNFGTEAQMAAYLPDLASAKRIGAFLLSEPHSNCGQARWG
jgi:alkylation response protein AidB-like acyl-CoA dehydrogenase